MFFSKEYNILGLLGPRKMTVLLPALTRNEERIEFQPLNDQESILAKFKNNDTGKLLELRNKLPQWNQGAILLLSWSCSFQRILLTWSNLFDFIITITIFVNIWYYYIQSSLRLLFQRAKLTFSTFMAESPWPVSRTSKSFTTTIVQQHWFKIAFGYAWWIFL